MRAVQAGSVESPEKFTLQQARINLGNDSFINYKQYTIVSFFRIMWHEFQLAWNARRWKGVVSNAIALAFGAPVPVARLNDAKNAVDIMSGGLTLGKIVIYLIPLYALIPVIKIIPFMYFLPEYFSIESIDSIGFYAIKWIVVEFIFMYFVSIHPSWVFNAHENLHAYEYYLLMRLNRSGVIRASDIEEIWSSRQHERLEDVVAQFDRKKEKDVKKKLHVVLEETIAAVQEYLKDKQRKIDGMSGHPRADSAGPITPHHTPDAAASAL